MSLPWNHLACVSIPGRLRSFTSDRRLAVFALIAANLIWGTSFVATKPVLDAIPPATLANLRLLIALAVLLPVLFCTGRVPSLGKGPALLGVTGVALVFLLQNMGLERTSATNGALLQSCVPVATVTLAFLVLRESLPVERVIAVVLSVGGTLIIVAFDSGPGSAVSPVGDALMLASALALAGYFVLGRQLFAETDALSLVAGASIYGLIALFPASMYEYSRNSISRPDASGWLSIVYLGLGASALAYCLEGRGLRHLEAGQVALFSNISPAIGVGAAALLLGEALIAPRLIGGMLVLAGAWLTIRPAQPAIQRRPLKPTHDTGAAPDTAER